MDEALFNELLECSVCLEQLDSNSKVLPCQHTFCKRCLEEIINTHKELRCPECRVLVDIKIDQLPTNILLIRLLEGIKNNPRLKQTGSHVKKTETTPTKPLTTNPVPNRPSQSHATKQSVPSALERKAVVKQTLHTPPCARAMYTYEGKEPGDLSFKKGDVILLQRRVDQNWYHGEVNGKFGFVPARYVRVLVPIPTHIPQCKALYDFSVAEKDEKDCLTFKKGEVITVIRRVDDNWAEGKLSDKIGIFPISFVEMNVAARSLMKLSVNSQHGPSRVAPPTPAESSSLAAVQSTSKSIDSSPKVVLHMLDSSTTSPSQSSSTTPSPSTPPSSSTSSSSLPRPQRVPPSIPDNCVVGDKPPMVFCRSASQRQNTHLQKEKRHSLSSISSVSSQQKSPQISETHKHSLEILTTSGGDILAASGLRRRRTPTQKSEPVVSPPASLNASCAKEETERKECSDKVAVATSALSTATRTTSSTAPCTVASTRTSSVASSEANHTPLSSAIKYIALYNYRPQKDDELELKKGEFYTVSEKCQDGWFKGTSLRTTHTGVFPGNYVQIAKPIGLAAAQVHQASSTVANVRTMLGPKSFLPVAHVPPRLKPSTITHQQMCIPPGGLSIATDKNIVASAVYVRAKTNPTEPRTSVAADLLDWAHSVTSIANGLQPYQQMEKKDSSKELANAVSNVVAQISSMTMVSSTGASSMMAASTLAQMASTSMAASYPTGSCQQDPASLPNSNVSQSWHAPKPASATPYVSYYATSSTSMSVNTPPNVSLKATAMVSAPHSKSEKQHKVRKDKTRDSLMKRFTSKKKTRLPVANFTCDNPSFVDSTVDLHCNDNMHNRTDLHSSDKLNSIQSNAEECAASDAQKSATNIKQPPLVRERFRCIVPYPPNSEYELELKLGDVVYVHKKREDGWYKGTLMRTGKTGLFPASFVDSF